MELSSVELSWLHLWPKQYFVKSLFHLLILYTILDFNKQSLFPSLLIESSDWGFAFESLHSYSDYVGNRQSFTLWMMYHFRNVVTEVSYVLTSQVNTALQLDNLHLHHSHANLLKPGCLLLHLIWMIYLQCLSEIAYYPHLRRCLRHIWICQ